MEDLIIDYMDFWCIGNILKVDLWSNLYTNKF